MYFAHTLPGDEQDRLFAALRRAGATAVRIFITDFGAGGKGTNSTGATDLESAGAVGAYADAVLGQVDAMLVRMRRAGVKAVVCMHDRWVLTGEWGVCDAYCRKYGASTAAFYSSPTAAAEFDARLAHIVNHRNPLMGNQPYKNLSDVIYAVELQNEAQGIGRDGVGMIDPSWWCNRATALKKHMVGSQVLISTGGGQTFEASLLSENFNCQALDVVAMHSYTNSLSEVISNVNRANSMKAKHQIVVFEEFGLNTLTKSVWIDHVAQVCNAMNVPWMPWELSTVGFSNDYEFTTANDNGVWSVFVKNSARL
ncbi:hypothetical protein HDU83_003206 [Entophlyctis luteolus]|nr:hypothetical protein HDU83_003206 [Entophlyctis luteolus]